MTSHDPGNPDAAARSMHPRDERCGHERLAAEDPWYALALAKAALIAPEPTPQRATARIPLTAPAMLAMRYPAFVAGGSFVLGILLWRSPWTRNALRLAALWGIKNVVSRKLNTMF